MPVEINDVVVSVVGEDNSENLRKAYNDNLIKLTEFYTNLSQDESLYKKYQSLKNSVTFYSLTSSQKRVIDNILREFKLGGAELNEGEKKRFKVIQEKLAKLSTQFEENILDATNEFSIFVDHVDELSGIPEENIKKARAEAKEDKKEGYKFTLHFPSYLPVMQYADSRALREKLYHGYATRASELASPKFDNTNLIDEILALRYESSQLLGFKHFTEMSLVTKMAKSSEEVITFLMDLANKAKPFALKDMDELKSFAKTLKIEKLEAWDVAYVSEKLRQAKYSFSENEVKQYFPEHRVLKGLFKVVETIFKLKIIKSDAPIWHKDVSFYSIKNEEDRKLLEIGVKNLKCACFFNERNTNLIRIDGSDSLRQIQTALVQIETSKINTMARITDEYFTSYPTCKIVICVNYTKTIIDLDIK